MKPKTRRPEQDNLLRPRLVDLIDMRHELVKLEVLIDWEFGGRHFFGEPALELSDLMRTDPDGRGRIGIIAAHRLVRSPRLYATVLMWLLSELFEELQEAGAPDKPKLVFFFDEAHLLFDDAPKALVDKVEQVARLIRSKGVGVFFVTQQPSDVPDDILAQLGHRVQHALRAFTADDRRELKRAAETYRDSPRFDIATAISEVGTGEAVTSFLVEKGAPGMAERTLLRPPSSRLGTITDEERAETIAASPLRGKYETEIDRESAHEILAARAEAAANEAEADETESRAGGSNPAERFRQARRYDGSARRVEPAPPRQRSSRQGETFSEAVAGVVIKELKGTTAGVLSASPFPHQTLLSRSSRPYTGFHSSGAGSQRLDCDLPSDRKGSESSTVRKLNATQEAPQKCCLRKLLPGA